MSRILQIAREMAEFTIVKKSTQIINTIIHAKCSGCKKSYNIKIGALYKQYKRGSHKYLCRSCSSIQSWTKDKRQTASKKSKQLWCNPTYAGTIDGKAIANEIRRLTDE